MKHRKQSGCAGIFALPAFMKAFVRKWAAPVPSDNATSAEAEVLRAEIASLTAEIETLRQQKQAPVPALDLRYPSGQAVPPGALPWTHPTPLGAQFLIPDTNGETRTIELTQSAGTVVLFRDNTQTEAQTKLTEAAHLRARQLTETSRALVNAADAQSVYRAITEGARSLLPDMDSTRVLLYSYGGHGGPIILQCTDPEEMPKRPRTRAQASPPEFPFNAASPLLWKLYIAREHINITNPDTDPVLASSEERAFLRGAAREIPPITAALFLPLIEGVTTIGHLLVTCADDSEFDDDIVQTLTTFSCLAALACARVRLAVQTHRHLDQNDALWTACAAALVAETVDAAVDTLTEMAASALGASVCTLTMRVARDMPRQTLGTHHRDARLDLLSTDVAGGCPCDRLTREAADRGCPVQAVGVEGMSHAACPWSAFAGQSGGHSALSVPVPGNRPGSLSVIRHGGAPFTPHEVRLAETFAHVAALALRGLLEAQPGAE